MVISDADPVVTDVVITDVDLQYLDLLHGGGKAPAKWIRNVTQVYLTTF